LALVAVGAATFAAFESHLIDVRAHNEKATYVSPNEIDLGTTLMQMSYSNQCAVKDKGPDGLGGTVDDTIEIKSGVDCLRIYLSKSFLEQDNFGTVGYKIFCEAKPAETPPIDHGITEYMQLSDSDGGGDSDSVTAINCVHAATPGSIGPAGYPTTSWANGKLIAGNDEYDLWDFDFYAPVCSDNYNAATDEGAAPPSPIPPTIDSSYCHKGPGPDSDEYVNLGSNIKFQITEFEK